MGAIVVALLIALLLAAAVMVYVAYPYRGARTPVHPALGEAMRRGVQALPTVPVEADRPVRNAVDASRQRS